MVEYIVEERRVMKQPLWVPSEQRKRQANLTRFLSHVASTGLAFATYLAAWRRCKPLCGLMVELTVGALIHSFVNTAYYWPVSPTGVYQLVAALALFIAAVGALHHLASQEPLSARISGVFPTER